MNFLFECQEHCDLDVKNACEQTALHIALIAGHLVVAELLVGYGADINAADKDGDTPLHYVFVLHNVAAPSKYTPQLLKVCINFLRDFCNIINSVS